MKKFFYVGACHIYNALKLINYPRCDLGFGLLHSVEEMLQVLKIVNGDLKVPKGIVKFLFRNNVTPKQEQLTKPEIVSLANATDSDKELVDLRLLELYDYDLFIFEITTLGECERDGYFYHRNPNLYLPDIPWENIKSCGFYEQYAPHLGVHFYKDSYDSFSLAIKNIVDICSPKPIIFVSHIMDKKLAKEMPWLQVRLTISDWLDQVCNQHKNIYHFNPSQVIEKYGFKIKNGKIDNAHLTNEAQAYYAKLLKEMIDSI